MYNHNNDQTNTAEDSQETAGMTNICKQRADTGLTSGLAPTYNAQYEPLVDSKDTGM